MANGEHLRDRISDLRQLAVDSLSRRSGGFAELERIDRNMDSIIQAREGILDESWIDSLIGHGSPLEITRALAFDGERYQPVPEEEAEIQEAIVGLLTEFRNDGGSCAGICTVPITP